MAAAVCGVPSVRWRPAAGSVACSAFSALASPRSARPSRRMRQNSPRDGLIRTESCLRVLLRRPSRLGARFRELAGRGIRRIGLVGCVSYCHRLRGESARPPAPALGRSAHASSCGELSAQGAAPAPEAAAQRRRSGFGSELGAMLGMEPAAGLAAGCVVGRQAIGVDGHRERHLGAPSRGLDLDPAAFVLGLPLDALLRVGAHDPDLSELPEMARERRRVAQLAPQLRRRLDQRALGLGDHHRQSDSSDRVRLLPRERPRGGGAGRPG